MAHIHMCMCQRGCECLCCFVRATIQLFICNQSQLGEEGLLAKCDELSVSDSALVWTPSSGGVTQTSRWHWWFSYLCFIISLFMKAGMSPNQMHI